MTQANLSRPALLIRRTELFHRKMRFHGLLFGRYISDPVPVGEVQRMWIHPDNREVMVTNAPLYPREGGRGFDASIPDYVQDTGEYHLERPDSLPLPQCPFLIVPGKDDRAGTISISVKLLVRCLADLPDFSVLLDSTKRYDPLMSREQLAGIIVKPSHGALLAAAQSLALTSGMYLVVEREHPEPDDHPMILRLGHPFAGGLWEVQLFWFGACPRLTAGEQLWRRLAVMMPENDRFRGRTYCHCKSSICQSSDLGDRQ